MARSEQLTRGRAFTTIEMLAVLCLAGLLSGLTTLSLASPKRSADARDVVDHIAYADELVREMAREHHRTGRIAFDLSGGTIADATGSAPRTIYRLPGGWTMDRLMVGGDGRQLDATTISLSPAGWSPPYAARLTNGNDTRWIIVNGITGQVRQCNDEREATDTLEANRDDSP